MKRTQMLRFSSDADLNAMKARRAAFNSGSRGREPAPLERDVQKAVLAFLRKHPKVAWAHRFNSGVTKIENKDGTERFVRYSFKGCADILGQLRDGRFLACECKRDGEKPTDDQRAFIDTVNSAHGIAFVAYRIEDAAEALR